MNGDPVQAAVSELAAYSARIGRDLDLVQGAGGNTSVKLNNTLWVKASGAWLSEADSRDIFVPLDLGRIQANIDAGQEDFSACVIGGSTLRPSIETSLHALMPQRIVVHCHSVDALAWAVQRDGREQLARRLAGLDWLWVDYARPGLALSQAVLAARRSRPAADVLILGNHGLVLAAQDIAGVDALLAELLRRLGRPQRAWSAPGAATLAALGVPGARLPAIPCIHALASDPVARRIAVSGALYPDHAVFLGTAVPAVDAADDTHLTGTLAELLAERPHCAIVQRRGVLLGADCTPTVEAMLACCALVGLRIEDPDRVTYLSDTDVASLVNWDMERHRMVLQKLRGR